MIKILGKIFGKTEVAKEDIKNKIDATKQATKQSWENVKEKTSNKVDAAADKFSKAANNAAHPIDFAKLRFEEGRQEVLKQREEEKIRERLNRELNSQSIRMQEQANNRRKMMAGVAMNASQPSGKPAGEKELENDMKQHDKDDNKINKKEGKLMDKESDEINKNDSENKKFMNKIDDLRKGPSSGRGWAERGPGMLIFFALAIFIFDIATGTTRPPSYPLYLGYGVMIIIALIMNKTSGDRKINSDFLGLTVVIAFAIIYPWAIDSLRENIPYQWIVDLLGPFLLFPPVVVYLMFKYPENSAGHKIAVWIITGLVIYAFIVLLNSPTFQGTSIAGKTTIDHPRELIKGFAGNVLTVGQNMITNIDKSFQIAIARATGQQYEGEEEEQRGILIDNVRSVEKNYYTSSDIYVQANIKSQNLLGEVGVRTRCYVKDRGNGTTYPEALIMVNDDENIIDCHLGQLPKGNYQVFVTATFIFITDADIQYYFVDEKTRPELYKSMKIPDKSTATYTGGPVMVGLPSLNQPLRISADGSNKNVGNYPFGVSLTNSWSQGKVNRGINYTLEVPAGFELLDCNRKNIHIGTGTQNDRTAYVFRTDDQNIKETFDSVTCRMHVTNAQRVFNGDLVAIKTFNARAVYEYTVEGSTNINVQQDFYGDGTQTN